MPTWLIVVAGLFLLSGNHGSAKQTAPYRGPLVGPPNPYAQGATGAAYAGQPVDHTATDWANGIGVGLNVAGQVAKTVSSVYGQSGGEDQSGSYAGDDFGNSSTVADESNQISDDGAYGSSDMGNGGFDSLGAGDSSGLDSLDF